MERRTVTLYAPLQSSRFFSRLGFNPVGNFTVNLYGDEERLEMMAMASEPVRTNFPPTIRQRNPPFPSIPRTIVQSCRLCTSVSWTLLE